MCKRVFKLDIDLQILHYTSAASGGMLTALDDDENTLSYFGIVDGAEIFMNEVDLKAKEKEEKRKEEKFESEVVRQEESVNTLREIQMGDVEKERVAAANAKGGA
jgi:hypothetical protein